MADQEIKIPSVENVKNKIDISSTNRLSSSSRASEFSNQSGSSWSKIVIKGLRNDEMCDLALQLEDKDHVEFKIHNGPNENDLRKLKALQRLSSSYSKEASFVSHYISNYDPQYLLGRGGFGVVIESKNLIDEKEYAIKIIKLPNKEDEKDKVLREVKHMAKLEHQNIVTYLGTWFEYPTTNQWLDNLLRTHKLEEEESNDGVQYSQEDSNVSSEHEGNEKESYLCIKMQLCERQYLNDVIQDRNYGGNPIDHHD